jgi:hypothetical protein
VELVEAQKNSYIQLLFIVFHLLHCAAILIVCSEFSFHGKIPGPAGKIPVNVSVTMPSLIVCVLPYAFLLYLFLLSALT